MVQNSGGPAPYIYVSTRLRVRKAKLLPPEEYQRMLNMSLPEIIRLIGETEYQKEVDELGTSFEGIDLIEVALSWNLAKEYQRVIELAPGSLKEFTMAYLRRWDIYNILTILRGKMQGMKEGKIKEVLIPAGSLDRTILDRVLAEENCERVADALKSWKMYPTLSAELSEGCAIGSFARLENELYKRLYADLLQIARRGVKGGNQFLKFVQLEIDVKNIKTLFRMRGDGYEEDAREFFIPGATFTPEELQQMNQMTSRNEVIDALLARIKAKAIQVALEDLRTEKSEQEVDAELTKTQLDHMEQLSKINPFSIHPILVYLEKKKYEVFNLRAIARGKESRLAGDTIAKYLVI
ncbi:V-type ATP synthase subunit C [Methanospirillum hungatei]|uniref:V-type ATP synthase subunit C n=1 Tax=Methanospirillum hungatei TaxID=2203 RepID=UPI0026E9D1D4|nr:V-type ATP synthase subunit C [Methanospirillum hungatei]MCA1916300.1 V-type ATP synthase subunit C [Methanospirillum hungatei]